MWMLVDRLKVRKMSPALLVAIVGLSVSATALCLHFYYKSEATTRMLDATLDFLEASTNIMQAERNTVQSDLTLNNSTTGDTNIERGDEDERTQ